MQIYQINANSLRVLAESDAEVEIPPVPLLLKKQEDIPPLTGSSSQGNSVFTSFQVSPSKSQSENNEGDGESSLKKRKVVTRRK